MAPVGILATAIVLPPQEVRVVDIFTQEGATHTAAVADQLGIRHVHTMEEGDGSAMALQAAHLALEKAQLAPKQVDVIVDYSIAPQTYLVPSWSMANQLQHELGATKAFTLGFSGGGATNFLVAMQAAWALIQQDPSVQTALLVGAERALPQNRLLHPEHPMTVLGDGASAVVLGTTNPTCTFVDLALTSQGSQHEVYHIPGGGLTHPLREDLYRVHLDARWQQPATLERLTTCTTPLLAEIDPSQLHACLYPNISRQDRHTFQEAMGFSSDLLLPSVIERQGYLHGTDLVANYAHMMDEMPPNPGMYVLACSHGMGFLAGALLLQF